MQINKRKNIAQGYALCCQKRKYVQLFKCCEWAGSIMANALCCRQRHAGSIPVQSNATNQLTKK